MNTEPELFTLTPAETAPPARTLADLSPQAKAVLAELRQRPGATDHLADRLGYPLMDTRVAMLELDEAGQIVDSGERAETPSYAHAIVWQPAP